MEVSAGIALSFIVAIISFSPGLANNSDWRTDEVLQGPASRSERNAWLQQIKDKRSQTLESIDWDGQGVYNVSDLEWTQSAFVQPQMHPFDRQFYNHTLQEYTPDKFVAYLNGQYGGVDSILMWPTYPMTGVDDRNQFDLWRAAPNGGIKALATAIAALKTHGIRVLMPYNPWDQGTRYEGRSDPEAMADLLQQLGADGFNGDTMSFVNSSFYTAGLPGQHIAIEPELGGNLSTMKWASQGWGYWPTQLGRGPPVDGYKWLDGRRITGICNRWAQNHTVDLMHAWFNGIAFVSWQNVWTVYNRMTDRDSVATRRFASMSRFLGGGRGPSGGAVGAAGQKAEKLPRSEYSFDPPLLRSRDWEPFAVLTEEADAAGVFGSYFPAEDRSAAAYTLVSFEGRNYSGPVVELQPSDYPADTLAYDCYHGVKIGALSDLAALSGGDSDAETNATIHLDIESGGFGCILLTNLTASSSPALARFLDQMNMTTGRALASYDATWRYTNQTLVSAGGTYPVSGVGGGYIKIPAGQFDFQTTGMEIEGNDDQGVDVQFPWESHPQREHQATMTMPSIYMSAAPATAEQYRQFVVVGGYFPKDTNNWLKNWDWSANGRPSMPPQLKNRPVTYVSYEDAKMMCNYYNVRLPETYEWQWTAQAQKDPSTDTLWPYPWGPDEHPSCIPLPGTGRTIPGATTVNAMPGYCNSSFGLVSLVGNVWELTSRFQDDHSEAVIVKGGSNYQPQGSKWYFPQPTDMRLDYHNKLIRWDDSYERVGTVGFRCMGTAVKSETRRDLCGGKKVAGMCSFIVPAYIDLDFAGAVRSGAPVGSQYDALALDHDERGVLSAAVRNADGAFRSMVPPSWDGVEDNAASRPREARSARVLVLVESRCNLTSRVADGGTKSASSDSSATTSDVLELRVDGQVLDEGPLARVSGRYVVLFEAEGGAAVLETSPVYVAVKSAGASPRCEHRLVEVGMQTFVAQQVGYGVCDDPVYYV